MNAQLIGVLGILLLFVLLGLRMYIGMAMALVGFLGLTLIVGFEAGSSILGITPLAEGSSYTLSVIPLFVLMGQFALISGISSDIYKTVYAWLGHMRGGLAMATIIACSGFAAICGSSLATGATMGMVAIPEMERFKYDPRLATGCIAAGGTPGHFDPAQHRLCALRHPYRRIHRQIVYGRRYTRYFIKWHFHLCDLHLVPYQS